MRLKRFIFAILYGVFPALYAYLLVYALLFKNVAPFEVFSAGREYVRSVNLVPFHTITGYVTGSLHVPSLVAMANVLGNILLFVPLGIYLHLLRKGKKIWGSLLAILLMTLLAEACQYAFGLGAADVDDMILNFLGGIAGIMACRALYALLKSEDKVRMALVVSGILAIALPFLVPALLGLQIRLI